MKNLSKAADSTVLPSILVLAFMASLGPFGDTEYTPSLPRIAHAFGTSYSSLIEAPRLVLVELGYPSKTFTVVALCIVGGFIVGAGICGWLSRYLADSKLVGIGLCIMLAGSLAVGGFDRVGWVTLPTMLASIATIYVGLAFVVPIATSRAVVPFERIAGSASALLGSVSMGLASASTLLISALPHDSATAMFFPGALFSIVGNFIEPKILGKSVQIHPLAVLLALMFWGVLWGPLGILLATPITGILALLSSYLSITRPIANVLSGKTDSLPPRQSSE